MSKKLKQAEFAKIYDMIKAVFIKVDDVWHWKTGWSDDRIATESGVPGCTAEHVKRLRRNACGEVPKPERGGRVAQALAAVKAVEERLGRVEKQLAELLERQQRPNGVP